MGEVLVAIPPAAWTAVGVVLAALVAAVGAFIGSWVTNRRNAKVDAGQLALEYAKGLRDDVDDLKTQVAALKAESNAYRSHAHVLHEWGGYVETPERPRPVWPQMLPR